MRFRNKMTAGEYLFYHAVLMMWGVVIYRNSVFLTAQGLGINQSAWTCLIFVALSAAIGVMQTLSQDRTFMNLSCNFLLPYAVFTFYTYYSRNSVPILFWVALGIGTALCLATALLFISDHSCPKTRRTRKTMALRLRNIMAVVLATVLLPYSWVSVARSGNTMTRSAVKPSHSNIEQEAFDSSIRRIAFLMEKETRSLQETHELCQTIANIEAAYWGLPYSLDVEICTLSRESILGCYNNVQHLICINEYSLQNITDIDLLDTVLHEVYHSVEYCRVAAYEQVSPELQASRIFQAESIWRAEFQQTPESGSEEYFNQSIEKAARQYAIERSTDYLVAIGMMDPGDYTSERSGEEP